MELLFVVIGLAILMGFAWLVDSRDKTYDNMNFFDDDEEL
jgi:hypothetical protein